MSNGLNVCGAVLGMPDVESQNGAAFQAQNDEHDCMRQAATSGVMLRCGELYGSSDSMQHLYKLITKVAPTRANVLISGESGTGKELVASEIHRLGKESDKPFVALNCGAISPQLIE